MQKTYKVLGIIGLIVLGLSACRKMLPPSPADDELLDGPVEGLTTAQKKQFIAGDIAFNDVVFTPETGLGPFFVATSCGTCHAGDGRGHPFTTLTRFGQSDTLGNTYMSYGGPQLQNRAIPGYTPETMPAGAAHANFIPPPNTGLGFIDALTDQAILANADPTDADGDGISGRPNYVTAPYYFMPQPHHMMVNGKYIGRFGRKGAAVNLWMQTVNAYNQDMGITSEYAPLEPYINGVLSPYGDAAPDPEVSSSELLNVVFYLRTLKAPIQRTPNDAAVVEGKQIFLNTGCAKCHTESFSTGDCDIQALAHKTIYPYSDFLLHDMGAGLDDGYTEGTALTAEWKTPPLWGLGLAKNSSGGSYFLLHDGRAHSIEQAITLHGGEAESVIAAYNALSADAKAKLIKFLESL